MNTEIKKPITFHHGCHEWLIRIALGMNVAWEYTPKGLKEVCSEEGQSSSSFYPHNNHDRTTTVARSISPVTGGFNLETLTSISSI